MIRFLALLLLLLLPGMPVQAQPADRTVTPLVLHPPPPAPTPLQTAAEAMVADAAEYARMFGVSLPEALRRLGAQEASVRLVDLLAEGYRERLAGIVIEHAPTYRILFVVTGPPAPDITIAVAPFGVPIVVRTGARATRSAILEAIERHQGEIRAALPSPPGMGVEPLTGSLLVITGAGDLDGDADSQATASRLATIANVPVEVRTWGDFAANLSVEGGGRLVGHDAGNPARFVCTSGFVVSDGSRSAIATAAHCPDALSFVDRAGGISPLAMIGAWGARYQDVQLHGAEGPLRPAFYGDTNARGRPVATWRNRLSTRAGDFVCHRGERTGYSCALVQFVDYAPPGDLCAGPCPPTWVAVNGPQCRAGDSGGPVFLGTVAFGLVKGDSVASGRCRLYYYMSTDYLPEGWTLLRGPTASMDAR